MVRLGDHSEKTDTSVQHLHIESQAPLLPGQGNKRKIIASRMAFDWREKTEFMGGGATLVMSTLGRVPSRLNDCPLDG